MGQESDTLRGHMRTVRREYEDEVIRAARWAVLQGAVTDDLVSALSRLDGVLTKMGDQRGAHNWQDTSVSAAQLAQPTARSVRRQIIDMIYHSGSGMTDDELERQSQRIHTTISSARNWLCSHGWLVDSGDRRKTLHGREAIVWQISPGGMQQVRDPKWVAQTERNSK